MTRDDRPGIALGKIARTIVDLEAERDAYLAALEEQIAECFDPRCEMCARHEAVIARFKQSPAKGRAG